MNKVGAKIYYLLSTGEILLVISEGQWCVEETTKGQDFSCYPQLQDKNMDEVDFIELPYGSFATVFTGNIKSYSVDIQTKQLNLVQYTQDELNAIEQQNQDVQDLNSRVSDISTYLSNSDETAITDIENSILEIEKNKIINGGI